MSSPDSLEIDIEFLNESGDGVARLGRRQIIVPFTIPGERVRVRLEGTPLRRSGRQEGTPQRRSGKPGPVRDGRARAVVDAIVRASPQRVAPRCAHFGPCGGCAWQHIAYPEQLRLKTALVTRLVRDAVPAAPAARAMVPGTAIDHPWGYRHKVHFVFGSIGRTSALAMGHYERGSRQVVHVRECPVHDERGNATAFRFRDAYQRAGAAGAPAGSLKSLAIRVGVGTPELMGTLVLTSDADKRVRGATRRALAEPGAPSSFHVNLHPKGDAFIFGATTRHVSGTERMREDVAGTSFLISPTAFFQTNVQAAEVLVRLVLDAVPAGGRVLDLYAGAGLFALPLARGGREVVAIEENRAAVADGEASRRMNRIPEQQCRFVARRVEQALADIGRSVPRRSPASGAPFDAVVLDPPRDGCSPAVIEGVFAELAPATAIYVSCNPEALARDLAAITRLKYRIVSIQPVDMFPHTAHVETVAVLAR